MDRNNYPEVFSGKDVLRICNKFTGGYLCRSAISIKLQSNFIGIKLRHGCSLVNLQHIFRISFPRNTSGWSTFANFVSSKAILKNNGDGVGFCLEILLIKEHIQK